MRNRVPDVRFDRPSRTIVTDAEDTGWAGVVLAPGQLGRYLVAAP